MALVSSDLYGRVESGTIDCDSFPFMIQLTDRGLLVENEKWRSNSEKIALGTIQYTLLKVGSSTCSAYTYYGHDGRGRHF